MFCRSRNSTTSAYSLEGIASTCERGQSGAIAALRLKTPVPALTCRAQERGPGLGPGFAQLADLLGSVVALQSMRTGDQWVVKLRKACRYQLILIYLTQYTLSWAFASTMMSPGCKSGQRSVLTQGNCLRLFDGYLADPLDPPLHPAYRGAAGASSGRRCARSPGGPRLPGAVPMWAKCWMADAP